jgi:hypothetical protein
MQDNPPPIPQPADLVVPLVPATLTRKITIGNIYELTYTQKLEVSEYHQRYPFVDHQTAGGKEALGVSIAKKLEKDLEEFESRI